MYISLHIVENEQDTQALIGEGIIIHSLGKCNVIYLCLFVSTQVPQIVPHASVHVPSVTVFVPALYCN